MSLRPHSQQFLALSFNEAWLFECAEQAVEEVQRDALLDRIRDVPEFGESKSSFNAARELTNSADDRPSCSTFTLEDIVSGLGEY